MTDDKEVSYMKKTFTATLTALAIAVFLTGCGVTTLVKKEYDSPRCADFMHPMPGETEVEFYKRILSVFGPPVWEGILGRLEPFDAVTFEVLKEFKKGHTTLTVVEPPKGHFYVTNCTEGEGEKMNTLTNH